MAGGIGRRLSTCTLPICEIHLHLCRAHFEFTYSPRSEEGAAMSEWTSVIIRVRSGTYEGIGEAGAFPCKSLWATAVRRARELIGQDAMRREALLPELAFREGPMSSAECMVREAMDTALHDLLGKALGVPVHLLLGGARRMRVPGMPVVHVAAPEVMARRSRKWVDNGFRYLKVKLAGEPDQDVTALRAVRKAVGNEVRIQVDTNRGGGNVREILKFCQRIEDRFDVEIIEDPLPYEPEAYARIRRSLKRARLMVDAEATWPRICQVIHDGSADMINHHPNRQGGLVNALRIDHVARGFGLDTAIGSSGVFGIQNTAFQVLSAIIGLSRPCEDVGLHLYCDGPTKGEYDFQTTPSVLKVPYDIRDGVIHISSAPGLGVEMDERRLDAFTIKRMIVT